ncbi:MAG: ribonuclease J [Spiroplasma sp.]|nr:ribonuclease J [Spiroplasma sp.]
MAKIKFVALGGLDERGKNLYLIEINNNIFIFDVGLKFPEREMLGVDVIIPDFGYLKENRHRIKAIFISKPSDDSFGALPYLLKDLTKDQKTKLAIYSSDLTKFMIEQKLKYFRFMNNNIQLHVVNVNERIEFNDINVFIDAFNTTSSIPGSLGFAIHSRNHPLKAQQKNYADDTIFYLSDYILVGNENNDFTTKIDQIAKIRSVNKANQVLLLISEGQTALRKDFTAPNHKIQNRLEPIIKEAPGRIILACYDQDLFRVNEIFQAMAEVSSTRKVAIHGRTLNEVLQAIANPVTNKSQPKINVKGFNVTFNANDPDKNKIRIVPLQLATKIKDSVVVVTGSGERLFAKMNKIATNNDDELNLLPDDTVILATPPIPGNELAHAAVLDELARTDVKVISISDKQAWSLQASYEDIKLLTNMLEPKYFLPVKGLYKDLNGARNAAIDAGVLHNNALIQDNGEVVTFNNGVLSDVSYNTGKNASRNKDNPNLITTGDVYVDGIGVGDIGAIVIEERRRLMSDGVLITGLTIDRKTKQITSLIDAQMRGVVYLTNNEEMLKKIQTIIINIVEKAQKSNNFSTIEIKNKIKNELQDFMKKETGKIPMILPVINEI